ncbi:MAG: hypothetical protein PSV35_07280 [bacterium]|nr:hypothetical protein [bacterium]
MILIGLRRLTLIIIILNLFGCYRTPNLNGQSIGSATGAAGGGLFAASQIGGNLIVIGAGTIVGSILGGVIGSSFDDMHRVKVEDPSLWPITVECYQTRRPTYMAKYCPGVVVPPQKADMYQNISWANYPAIY